MGFLRTGADTHDDGAAGIDVRRDAGGRGVDVCGAARRVARGLQDREFLVSWERRGGAR